MKPNLRNSKTENSTCTRISGVLLRKGGWLTAASDHQMFLPCGWCMCVCVCICLDLFAHLTAPLETNIHALPPHHPFTPSKAPPLDSPNPTNSIVFFRILFRIPIPLHMIIRNKSGDPPVHLAPPVSTALVKRPPYPCTTPAHPISPF
jgi:hypothetical protein